MSDRHLLPPDQLKEKLSEPAMDIRYLLSRGYKKKSAITFVSDHHRLTEPERHILTRLVFSPKKADDRSKKKLECSQLKGCDIFVDGYNVLITIETALKNEPLWFADDGFLRDTSGIFSNHKITDMTCMAVDEMLSTLSTLKMRSATILLDSQMSNSGILAELIRKRSKDHRFKADARTSKHVDFDLKEAGAHAVIATADSVIVDGVEKVIDITECWMKQNSRLLEAFSLNSHMVDRFEN
ncbi:DUF434 domain-containing protein [Methanococcoides alaskense]|uniref:DUF434 domain-containing protein n=1 Tax=Methanococcoides alaskense TaxID=325778 RepID=A0AA90Z961_9EURY|nr:DUF434 domain-containing protein [Methanococcoides alaskense]MDA0524446.1 DUF434 domain-containing protein [Methanococcoides alaskense]MDR6223264.1 hypothetical protein [Methanococcoides alaskense]